MNSVPTLVSVLFLVWASAVTLHVQGIGWWIPAYVVAQCLFVLLAWFGMLRLALGAGSYAALFNLTFFAVLALALIASCNFLISAFPAGLAAYVVIGAAFSASGTAAVVYWRLLGIYKDGVPASLLALVFQAAILSFCGTCTLLTLFAPAKAELRIAAQSLGLFWFLMSAFFFAYCVGIVRMHTAWAELNYWVPMFVACACFGWLAWRLGHLEMQPVTELAQQVSEVAAR